MLTTDGKKDKKMGMFDDIIVPKSYLKGLLTKEQEKLVKSSDYQTKSLENFLGQYKVYRQKLFVKENKEWVKDTRTAKINFYMSFYDKDENMWWSEYEFTFNSGVLDTKKLIKFEIEETAEEAEARDKEWEKKAEERKLFEKTFKYRFFSKLTSLLRKLLSWSEQKTYVNYISMPAEKREKEKEKLSFWKHS